MHGITECSETMLCRVYQSATHRRAQAKFRPKRFSANGRPCDTSLDVLISWSKNSRLARLRLLPGYVAPMKLVAPLALGIRPHHEALQ